MNQEGLTDAPQEEVPEVSESHEELSAEKLHEFAESAETGLRELEDRSSQETAALERSFTQSAQELDASPEEIAETASKIEQIEAQKGVAIDTARQHIETEVHEDPYQRFATEQKSMWAELGANPLTEAEQARASAGSSLESEQQSLEHYRARVESLRADIDEKKQGIIGRILNAREIGRLEQEAASAERALAAANEMVESRKQLFEAYDRMVVEQQELGRLMTEAYAENTAWDERAQAAYLEEGKQRDLSEISRSRNTYFVHEIVDAEWKPSANNRALDTKKLDWNDQLDILMGLHPTISTSTLDQGSEQRTFGGEGGWGAILSGGHVLGGGRSDIGSVAVGLRDRRLMSERDGRVDAIEDAISEREGTGYNELIVEQPQVAGVFCKWDDHMPPLTEEMQLPDRYVAEDGSAYRFGSWWKRMQSVVDRNVPVFVLDTNNQAHLVHDIDLEKRTFKITGVVTPERMQDMPGIYRAHLGSEDEKAAVGRVFDKVSGLLTDEEKSQFAVASTEGSDDDLE